MPAFRPNANGEGGPVLAACVSYVGESRIRQYIDPNGVSPRSPGSAAQRKTLGYLA